MTSGDALLYVDGFMALIGFYLIYETISMKKTQIIPSLLLAKEEFKKIKDRKKFISMIYSKLLLFSIVMTILGVAGVINDIWIPIPYFSIGEMVIFFIVFFIFMKTYQDARTQCIY